MDIIKRARKTLKFKNGYSLPEGQIYTGQWNGDDNTKEGYGL